MLGRSYDGVKLPHWVHILLSDLPSLLSCPQVLKVGYVVILPVLQQLGDAYGF